MTATGDARELDFHPGMGMRWEVTKSTEETSGEVFESINWLDPNMPGPPPHVHPQSEESFEILEGSLDVFAGGEWKAYGPGETATVPPGEKHTLRNGTGEPVKCITRIKPAGDSEEMFRTLHRLIAEGKVKSLPPKDPRSAVYAAMVFTSFPKEMKASGPIRGVFATLATIGKVLRFKL
jgi:mannose-6-phosphate isomerase-like protein (cupin superfamily)